MATLARHEVLWRRVMPVHQQADGSAQSAAFATQTLCVHRASLTSVDAIIQQYPDAHVYEFTVDEAFIAGATDVTDDRLPDEPADHAIVLGTDRGKVGKRLKKVARKVYPP